MKDDLRIFKLLTIICFSLHIASSLLFYFREQVYVRPEGYFYLLSLASAIAFAQILFFREDFGAWVRFIFFMESLLIALSFVLTQQALYKTVLSRDPWYHRVLVKEIVRKGHIPPYNDIPIPYVKMPNFHLLIASGIVLTDIHYKWAQFLFAGLPTLILLMLVAYLYSKKLFGYHVGLVSILLVAISDNILDMVGKNIVPNSVGVALAFLIFYLVCFEKLDNNKIKFLATLLAVSLVLMHTISFTFLLWQVLVVSILALIFRENVARNYLTFLSILIVLAFLEWALYSGLYFRTLTIILKQLFIYGVSVGRYEAKLSIPFLDVLRARLGMVLYFVIAGVTLLRTFIRLLKGGFRDRVMLSNVMATGGIVAGVGSFLMPALSEISHRFWYYGEVLSSAFVGSLFVHFMNGKNWRKILSVIFITLLSFLMFKASISNDDNPLVTQYSIRTGWYDSEIQAGMFVLYNNENILVASDWDYVLALNSLKWMFMGNPSSILNVAFPKSFTEIIHNGECLFVFRKSLIESRSFELGSRWGRIQYIPFGSNISEIIKKGALKKNIIYTTQNVFVWA